MKTFKNLSKVLSIVLLGTLMAFAAKRTVEFEVKGACGMCETRIEQTAKGIDGVKSADWTLEDNMLKLKFDDKKTSIIEVRKALAAVGHDNGNFRAPDEVYENLPACCHYVRDEAGKKSDCASGNCGDDKQAHSSMMKENGEQNHSMMMNEGKEHNHGMTVSEEKGHECTGTCSEEEKAACEQEETATHEAHKK